MIASPNATTCRRQMDEQTDRQRDRQKVGKTEGRTDRQTARPGTGLVVQFDWVLGRLQVKVGCCMQIASNCIFPVCRSVRTDGRTDGWKSPGQARKYFMLHFVFWPGQSELWLITKETRTATTGNVKSERKL